MEKMQDIKPRRVGFIDELRGLDIIAMVIYHALYDLVYIFGVNFPLFNNFLMPRVQPFIAGIFIVLAGISCRYSRSNIKRGFKTLLFGMLLTAVTLFFIPQEAIYFGILHFMGVSMILFALLKPLLGRISPLFGVVVSIVLYVLTLHLPQGLVGIEGLFRFDLPQILYSHSYLLPLGFGGMGSDYFPLMPFFFLFVAGSYLGVYFIQEKMPEWTYKSHSTPLSAIGKHTIVIYMLHQPIIMGLLWVYFKIA